MRTLFAVSSLLALATVCSSARLDNTYLPPGNALTAGGNGNFLTAPAGSAGAPIPHGGHFAGQGGLPAQLGSPQEGGFRAGQGSFGAQGGELHARPLSAPSGGYQGHSGNFAVHENVPILKFNNLNNGDGSYQYEYEAANGIRAEESGNLRNAGSDNEIQEAHGSFSYTGDDGREYAISYIANENGFQPQGDHLPTPPPIPEAILRSLEINAAEEAARAKSGGKYGYDGEGGSIGGGYQEGYSRGGQGGFGAGGASGQSGYQSGQAGFGAGGVSGQSFLQSGQAGFGAGGATGQSFHKSAQAGFGSRASGQSFHQGGQAGFSGIGSLTEAKQTRFGSAGGPQSFGQSEGTGFGIGEKAGAHSNSQFGGSGALNNQYLAPEPTLGQTEFGSSGRIQQSSSQNEGAGFGGNADSGHGGASQFQTSGGINNQYLAPKTSQHDGYHY